MESATLSKMQARLDTEGVKLSKWMRRAGQLFDIHRNWAVVYVMLDVELSDRSRDFGRDLCAVAITALVQRERDHDGEIERASHASWTDAVPPDCLCHWRYQTKPDVWRQTQRNPLCVHHGEKS